MKACEQTCGASERTVLRDLQELRKIGRTAGFKISDREHGDTFELSEFKARPAGLVAGEKRLHALMSELFKAFGGPVGDLAEGLVVEAGAAQESFFHVALPKLVEQAAVAKIYRDLEAAWQSNARVRFSYKGNLRTVEPAVAIVRSGRYYLIGRDIAKGKDGWCTFSMDLIDEPIKRACSFTRTRPPAKYLSTDAIGFFKGDGPQQWIDVTFSKKVSASAASRVWQDSQRVQHNADETVTISLIVDDVDEVIRWALSYGDDAWISSPSSAELKAKKILDRASSHYRK